MTTVSPSAAPSPAAVVADFESRARRVETPCGYESIAWRAWGSGPPVVLFHGAQGSWSHWIRNIDALAQSRTVWAVDLPGSGDSADPPDDDMASICADLARGLKQILGDDPGQEPPVDMVGFSFGGVVATYLAKLHPGLVRRLILVGAGGLGTPVGRVDMTRVRGLEGEARRAAHRHNLLALMIRYPDHVDELALYLQELNGKHARFNPGHLVLPDKLLQALGDIDVPVGAIWGEQDQPHPDPSLQEHVLRSTHPGLEFRVVPNAGHWVMYEQADAFNRILSSLLRVMPAPDEARRL